MSTSTNYSNTFTKEVFCKGDGFIIEGVLLKHHVQTIFLTGKQPIHETALPTRFVAITVQFDSAVKRNWRDGLELPPKMTRSTAITKGYLNKFDRVQSTLVDVVSDDQLAKAISNGRGNTAIPVGLSSDVVEKSLHPSKKGIFEFWCDIDKFGSKNFKVGDEVRIKTIGDSIFVESFTKMDQQNMANFSTDSNLGDSFANNIMKRYDDIESNSKNNNNNDDDDDDEWK